MRRPWGVWRRGGRGDRRRGEGGRGVSAVGERVAHAVDRCVVRGGDDVAAGDAAAYARARGYALSEDDLARLRAANRCDLEVAARANARMDGLLAEHGYAGKPR